MKVLCVSSTYFDDNSMIGGGERATEEYSCALSKKAETTLLVFGRKKMNIKRDTLDIVVEKPLFWIKGNIFNPFYLGLAEYVKKADVVHCFARRVFVANVLQLLCGIYGKKLVYSEFGIGGFNLTAFYDFTKFADAFIFPSEFGAKRYSQYSKISNVVYLGVNMEKFHPQKGVEREDKIVYVGRLLPQKGVNYLIEAAGSDIPLELYGRVYDREFYAYLKTLVRGDNVKFIHDADDAVIRGAYNSARASVLPSVYNTYNGRHHGGTEYFGLVVAEAMACGAPVIVTRAGSLPELVEEGVSGFVVEPNSPAALREKMLYMLNNRNRAAEMGKAARKRALENFTWDRTALETIKIYSRLLGAK